jgi:hypothetical protein
MKFVVSEQSALTDAVRLTSRPRATLERFTKPMAVPHHIDTYPELRQQIHHDLRIQHPEWVEPNGESPMCDSYEARLMEVLNTFTRRGCNESIAASHRPLEQEINLIDTVAL